MKPSLFYNGTILASFSPVMEYNWMLVENGTVSLLGKKGEKVPEHQGDSVQKIDLHGRTVMPGFIDAHMHLDSFGESLKAIDLVGVDSIAAMKELISSSDGVAGWIIGHGWDEHLFSENRLPTREDLDDAVPDRPVYLSRLDLHSGVLNSKGMEALEIERKYSGNPDLIMADRKPTGIVRESVFEYVNNKVYEICLSEPGNGILEAAISELARNGITSVGFLCCTLNVLSMLEKIREANGMKTRVRAYILGDELEDFNGFSNDEMLSVAGLKLFSDGSFGTKTALLSFQYEDDPGNFGSQITSVDKLIYLSRRAEEKGLDVAVHAIGDRALSNVIEAFSRVSERHRIDHAALVREDQIAEMQKLNPVLVVQPHFIITDFWSLDRLGAHRSRMMYPFRTLLDRGFELSLSTDCPVERINPWETVYAAITRGRNENIPLGVETPEECLTVEQALRAYTEGSAHAIRESRLGTLEIGQKADFLILERNPVKTEPKEIKKMKALETYVDGSRVFPS